MTQVKGKKPFKLTYKNLDRDIERCLDRYGTPDKIGSAPCIRGYDEAQQVVFHAYLEHKQYEAVAHYIATCWNWDWGVNDFFHKASDYFRREEQHNRLKRIWRAAIAVQKGHFWELHAIREQVDVKKSLIKVKRIVLDHMNQYRQILVEIEDNRELQRINEEIDLMERERRRMAESKPVADEITEELFWKIIETAGLEADSPTEQVEAITSRLEEFRASQIKRFRKILDQKMQLACHWDVWALAYMAQGGCSDDAFEGFRAWLILQGRRTFELALQDIRKAMEHVPPGLETDGAELCSAAMIAYETRAGKVLLPSKIRIDNLKGQAWEEDEIKGIYPEVFSFYSNQEDF